MKDENKLREDWSRRQEMMVKNSISACDESMERAKESQTLIISFESTTQQHLSSS